MSTRMLRASALSVCALIPLSLIAAHVHADAGNQVRDGELKPAGQQSEPHRAARKKNPFPADQNSVAAGRVVYTKHCQSCHGSSGKGDGSAARDLDPRPSDLSEPEIEGKSDGSLFWRISAGRKPMPAFEKLISEDERWHVINYVRALEKKQSQEASRESS